MMMIMTDTVMAPTVPVALRWALQWVSDQKYDE